MSDAVNDRTPERAALAQVRTENLSQRVFESIRTAIVNRSLDGRCPGRVVRPSRKTLEDAYNLPQSLEVYAARDGGPAAAEALIREHTNHVGGFVVARMEESVEEPRIPVNRDAR